MTPTQAVIPAGPHIIDILVAERAPKLCGARAGALAEAAAATGGHGPLDNLSPTHTDAAPR